MELKNVTIGYLNSEIQTGIIENGKTLYKLERENVGERICIIDNDKVIDIDDFNIEYELIKRDSNNRIINDIDFITLYAFEMDNVDRETTKSYKKRVKQYKKLNH